MSSSWPIRAASAVFGGALGAAIAPALQGRAHSGQLPGAMTARGLAVDGPALQLAAVVAGVFVFALIGELAARRLAGIRWATVSYCIAAASAPLAIMTFGNVRHVLLHGVAAVGIVLARPLNPRFTRDDVVLLPTLLATYFAFFDLGFGKTPYPTFLRAAIAVFALRLLIGWKSRSARPAFAFAAAPLAFVFQLQWMSPTLAAVLALAWIVATSTGGMFIAEPIASRALAYVVYPIAMTLYALSLVSVTVPLPVDFFEDGHDFTVASEMLRGEKPYRDVLPVHGFLADGGLDYLFMKPGADTMGKVLRARFVFTAATVAAIYCVGLAATGSGAMGCLAALLSLALFPGATFQLRAIPALLSLAGFVAAVRLRSTLWLIAGGVALGFAFLTSVDFAFFSTVVAIVVAARWREPLRAIGSIAAGLLGVILPALVIFAIGGFAIDFFRGTFKILAAGNVFVMGPFTIPDCLRSLSAMIWQLPDPQCL
ncbi:MAG TPA: hypothetical protein VJ853_05825, partial [Thermoanaerobaculia bacterium]|nr:hypothetical protein [Thermoanaerobaculia bacterium]